MALAINGRRVHVRQDISKLVEEEGVVGKVAGVEGDRVLGVIGHFHSGNRGSIRQCIRKLVKRFDICIQSIRTIGCAGSNKSGKMSTANRG